MVMDYKPLDVSIGRREQRGIRGERGIEECTEYLALLS